MRQRGFEIVHSFINKNVKLPARSTEKSAGYDISLIEDVSIIPGKVMIVPTGLKAYMKSNEYLGIHIRSSMAIKKQLALANCQAIIDSDYYNNSDNEGHILLALYNFGKEPVTLQAGTRIAQGIFYEFLKVDEDENLGVRQGGIGSTKEK